ncbi:hypothetical protein [Vibrio coralliirubri]|uniref:hypothetical protein n=1 Tax=Vibrio coralliirubri TaxID=1516159 RepID=UPI000B28E117|nr:hypothetical protein [Vibrio coralliirubri]
MKDVDRICLSLIDLYGLKYSKAEGSLSSPLMRWLDFVSRYIPHNERQIVLSRELTTKFETSLPKKTSEHFAVFAHRALNGIDLNPFQSKGLILHNDISDKKKQNRTDLLFADWGIHHFHLSNEIKSEQYFSSRSDWLLFALVYGDIILCVDILSHSEQDLFSRKYMLEIIYRNWPKLLEDYEMKGIVSGSNWSDTEIAALRKSGVSSSLSIDGKVFMPRGLGLTSAGVPLNNISSVQNVIHGVRCIANLIDDVNSDFKPIGSRPNNVELSLTTEGLALYDISNDIVYKLTRRGVDNDALNLLCDLIAPDWVWNKRTNE